MKRILTDFLFLLYPCQSVQSVKSVFRKMTRRLSLACGTAWRGRRQGRQNFFLLTLKGLLQK
jgi:hypothetical protein